MIEWQAKWIWSRSLIDVPNCYVYVRREFDIDAAPDAEAYVSCFTEYKLYANGRYVGRGPGPCEPGFQTYATHDVSYVLRPGRNVIAAVCYCRGRDASASESLRSRHITSGFLLQLVIERNGDRQVIVTDETWKVKAADDWDFSSVQMAETLGYQEVYDSRRKPVGWNVVGFDDAGWEQAYVIGQARRELVEELICRQIPPLKEWDVYPRAVLDCGLVTPVDDPSLDIATRMCREKTQPDDTVIKYAKEILRPGECAVISSVQDCYVILDFGMEVVGYPALKIRAGGQATVDLGYAETLDANGGVDPTRQGILQADRVILHGGRQEWHGFGRRAFRYVQLTIRNLDRPISIESIHVTRVGYPTELASTFSCSDELLNEIWRTGAYTLSLCMQDTYETCPLGDPVQRTAHARIEALINYYTFFDSALAAQAVEQFARRPGADPTWIVMLHDYCVYTADLGLVTQLYPRLREVAETTQDSQILRDASKLAAAVSNTQDALAWHERASKCVSSDIGAGTDPYSYFEILRAMAEQGRTSAALDLIRDKWGEMLRRGATTWWERFADEGDECGLCCGSAGVPTYFLPAEVLGVKPSTPGGGIVVQPRVGGLQWASGRIRTAAGFVEVEWRFENGVFRIDIEAPEGFIVAVPIDGFSNPVIDEIDLTPETPERRARRTYGWGNTIWRNGSERDPYLDWLSSQEAEPPAQYTPRSRCSAHQSYVWIRESISTHVRYEVHEEGYIVSD